MTRPPRPRIQAVDAPSPRLPPERRISLPFEVFTVNQRLGTYLERALEGSGVRPAEYAVYSLMLEAGPRTPTELAAALGMPPTTLSTYVATMESRGHVHRIPNPADGRSVRLVLTDRGRAVVREANPAFTRAHRALEASLDRPPDEIREALAALADAIDRASRRLADEADYGRADRGAAGERGAGERGAADGRRPERPAGHHDHSRDSTNS